MQLNKEPEAIESAISAFAPYVYIYGNYVSELMTAGRKPDKNDWEDLELFIYLQPDTFIATNENKWHKIAKNVGLDYRIRHK